MIKLLVETKGEFQLLDLGHLGQLVAAHRPSVVENSNFVQDRIGRNQIRVIGELKDEATDAEFVAYSKEAGDDKQLAIDSFLAEFRADAAEERPAPKKRGKKSEDE